MNNITKKLLVIGSLCFLSFNIIGNKETKTIVLSSPLLRVADNAGVFHGPIIDILQTRIDFINLVQGIKNWSGAIMHFAIDGKEDRSLTIYCRRPEIIYGATFIAIAPDHKLANSIATPAHAHAVQHFIEQRTSKSLFYRQMSSTNHAVFTGAYAINPITHQSLPIYVSDYAIECFDVRHCNARLGVPAHNSKDLEFAHVHKLPIKLVVDVQTNAHGKKEDIAAPLLDKQGNLTEAYLGEYSGCIVVNSDVLNHVSLKDAATYVIDYLEKNKSGYAHTQPLLYDYNNTQYSVKDLAKIETVLYKNNMDNAQTRALQEELRIALNYIQADFLELAEKFLINLKNTKTLMIALVEESCLLRNNNDCYLLRWTQLQGDFNEKEVFRRDIATIKDFTIFSKDLINFLGDFAHSCPHALENIRKQN